MDMNKIVFIIWYFITFSAIYYSFFVSWFKYEEYHKKRIKYLKNAPNWYPFRKLAIRYAVKETPFWPKLVSALLVMVWIFIAYFALTTIFI